MKLIKGFLISVEGIDGAGKDTVANMVVESFQKQLVDAVTFADLTSTDLGRQIRSVFMSTSTAESERMDPSSEVFLVNAARNENILRNVLPALNGTADDSVTPAVVVMNRYTDSTWVYQHMVKGVGFGTVSMLELTTVADLLPKFTLWVNTTPATAAQRMEAAGKKDYHESKGIEFHNAVFQGFARLSLENPSRFITINGEGDLEAVRGEVDNVVSQLLRVLTKGGYLGKDWFDAWTERNTANALEAAGTPEVTETAFGEAETAEIITDVPESDSLH